jgi:hypothetical protein
MFMKGKTSMTKWTLADIRSLPKRLAVVIGTEARGRDAVERNQHRLQGETHA